MLDSLLTAAALLSALPWALATCLYLMIIPHTSIHSLSCCSLRPIWYSTLVIEWRHCHAFIFLGISSASSSSPTMQATVSVNLSNSKMWAYCSCFLELNKLYRLVFCGAQTSTEARMLADVSHQLRWCSDLLMTNRSFHSLTDVHLIGTVMLVFGMGLYELFISKFWDDHDLFLWIKSPWTVQTFGMSFKFFHSHFFFP